MEKNNKAVPGNPAVTVTRDIPADDGSCLLPADYSWEGWQVSFTGPVDLSVKYKRKVFSKYYYQNILIYILRYLGRFGSLYCQTLAEDGSDVLSSQGKGSPNVSIEEMLVGLEHLCRKGFLYLLDTPHGRYCVPAFRLTNTVLSMSDGDVHLASLKPALNFTQGAAAGKIALGLLQREILENIDQELKEFPALLTDQATFVEKIPFEGTPDLIIGCFAQTEQEARLQEKISRLCANEPKLGRVVFASSDLAHGDMLAQKYQASFLGSAFYVYSFQDNKFYTYPAHEPVVNAWLPQQTEPGWKSHTRGWKRTMRGWR